MSHRPCSDRPCPGSSRGYTALQPADPKGTGAAGSALGKEAKKLQARSRGAEALLLTLSHPSSLKPLSSQTLHVSSILQREASGSEKGRDVSNATQEKRANCLQNDPPASGPSLPESSPPVSLLCHCPAPKFGSHSLNSTRIQGCLPSQLLFSLVP